MAVALAGGVAGDRTAAPAASRLVPALAVMSLGLLVVLVHRRVLGTFFALDDLVMFQQVHGLAAWPGSPWLWLSGVAWFRVVTPLWGEQPLSYHAAALLLHALNACLLGQLARRWGASRAAAWLAAGLFVACPLHFTVLLAATSVGELLALLFTLLALARRRADLAAATLIVLALLSKESVLLVPVAALAIPGPGPALRDRVRRLAPVAIPCAVAGAALLAWGAFTGRLGGHAYAADLGPNVVQNAGRLAGWSLWAREAIPDLHAGISGAAAWTWSLAAIGLTLLAAVCPVRPLVRAGAAWWWLAVLPVLPLVGRTYLHYLYVPLAGLALVGAGLFDAATERSRGRLRRPGLRGGAAAAATVLVLAYAALSDRQLGARMAARMPSVDWPLDPVLRKSEIARRSIADVSAALAGRRAKLVLLLPAAVAERIDLGTGRSLGAGTGERYELESVLDGGRSLCAFVPAVDSVEFAHDFVPGHREFTFFVTEPDGRVADIGSPPHAHAMLISTLLGNGHVRAAVEYADRALAGWPGDPECLSVAAFANERAGSHERGLELLRELVRVAPGDPLAGPARRVLAGLASGG